MMKPAALTPEGMKSLATTLIAASDELYLALPHVELIGFSSIPKAFRF
jgi:hypothetical protein